MGSAGLGSSNPLACRQSEWDAVHAMGPEMWEAAVEPEAQSQKHPAKW